ncbi:GPR endopeptidase [Clostridium sp. UBA4548]|uniref:GPR endopeptidase n=1 Tax=Clostridium sp. UBA4548 TaxID=1946361 RepID=UPI0025C29A36|nr:GPR endopeptidase [Clostridium sp. UBA4548]
MSDKFVSVRTDLALEAREYYTEKNNTDVPGIKVNEFSEGKVRISRVEVVNDEGERIIGKPKGTYVTLEFPEFVHYDGESIDEVSKSVAKELSPLVKLQDSMTALVVGLGNWNITPDAVGPKVVSKIMVTRHLKEYVPDSIDEGVRPVCAIAPGVLGITGMETGEIIRGIVEKIKPNLVICIDALASRKTQRVNRTIQIGNTGISPGAGIGNKRMELSEKTLGIPVLAIGIPTVVDAGTLANDTIDLVIDELSQQATTGGPFYKMLRELDRNEKQRLIQEVLDPDLGSLVVTPKDIDKVIESVSRIIANGINIALQPALTLDDINKYLN